MIDEDLMSKTVQAPLRDGTSYVGSAACGICHKTVYRHWLKTRHGTAYNTLVDIGHQYDLSVLHAIQPAMVAVPVFWPKKRIKT